METEIKTDELGLDEICGYKEDLSELFELVLDSQKSNSSEIKCECGKSFTKYLGLYHHMQSVHYLVKSYRCSFCLDFEDFDKEPVLKHMKTCFGFYKTVAMLKPFETKCSYCCYEFRNEKDLIDHLYTHDEFHKVLHNHDSIKVAVEKQYSEVTNCKCRICSDILPSKEALKDHLKKHELKPRTCPKCTFKSISNKEVLTHLKENNCHKKMLYNCSECDENFGSYILLCKHILSGIHNQEDFPPRCCKFCDFKGRTTTDLKKHLFNSHKPVKLRTVSDSQQVEMVAKTSYRGHKGPPMFLPGSQVIIYGIIDENKVELQCDTCLIQFNSKEGLNAHKLSHKSDPIYECSICGHRDENKENMKIHINNHTKSLVKCSSCPFIAENDAILKEHLLEHQSERVFKCLRCSFKCNNEDIMSEHLLLHSDGEKFLPINDGENTTPNIGYKIICGDQTDISNLSVKEGNKIESNLTENENSINQEVEIFEESDSFSCYIENKDDNIAILNTDILEDGLNTSQTIKLSVYQRDDGQFYCRCCDELTFNNEINLHTHLANHPDEYPYRCKSCHFRFHAFKYFKEHQFSHEPLLKCKECTFETHHKKVMTTHLRSHVGINPYPCKHCGLAFPTQVKYIRHHCAARIKQFPCPKCKFSADDQLYLEVHMECHDTDTLHSCNLCGFTTYRKVQLRTHQESHPELRPWKCHVCDYDTKSQSSLRRHFRKHTNPEKLEVCNLCGYKFYEKRALAKHLRSHQGPNLIKCDSCPFTSKFRGTITKHMKVCQGFVPKQNIVYDISVVPYK